MPFLPGPRARAKRVLRRLPEAVTTRLKAQNETNANQLVEVMKGFVPVDDGVLKASIRAVAVQTASGIAWSVRAGDYDAFYARFVEFGTAAAEAKASRRNRNYRRTVIMTRSYAAHHATEAQPFFWPSYRLMKRRMKSRMSRAGKKGIQEAVAK